MMMRTQDAMAGMLCPVCKVPLAMSDRQGIEIDYCPQCRGVWLDRGELDKIVERSLAAEAPAPQQASVPRSAAPPPPSSPWNAQPRQDDYRGGYGDRGYDPRYGKPKRKKSFLEDLFD
jgi:Zn-finger nucleic acid-binding protein